MSGSKEFGLGYNFPGYSPPSSKPILVWDPNNPATFLELIDTLSSYTGHAGKVLVVNTTEDGITVSTATVTSDKNHIHLQAVAATTWTITHALAKFPSVVVVDAGGHVIITDIQYISDSEVQVNFTVNSVGTVYLN